MHDLLWRNSVQGSSQPVDMLMLDGVEIARLHQRVTDLSWFVALDTHLGRHPQQRKDCTSYESGKAGVMTWALRHEARIRQEIEEQRSKRRR